MGSKEIILCDTDIMIRLFRKDARVKAILEKIRTEQIGLSIITHAEIYNGSKKKTFEKDKRVLNSFRLFHIDKQVSEIFNGIILNYTVTRHIKIPDALIASTA